MASRLEVLGIIRPGGHGKGAYAFVRCACGTEKVVSLTNARTGRTKSCGCLQREAASRTLTQALTKHGDRAGNTHSPLYNTWRAMLRRSTSPKDIEWHRYGGRGVQVVPEWRDYQLFRDWALANGYRDGLTIDRIDNDGDYSPENCRFLTRSENSRRAHLRDEAAQAMQEVLGI